MALGIQKEGSLIEDGGLGFPPRARKHELGQFLASQRSGAAKHRLELGCSPDLDDIVLTRRGASVGTGLVCNIANLLADIWLFATTMQIHLYFPGNRLVDQGLAGAASIALFQ